MILPGPLFAAIVAIILFFYFNHRLRIKREERRERLREKREEYLSSLLHNLKKNKEHPDPDEQETNLKE